MFIAEDPTLISIHANPLYPANIPPTQHNQLACVQNTACLLISGTFCSLNIYSRDFFHCAYRLCQVYASYSCQRMSFGVSLITFIVGWFTGWNQLPPLFFFIFQHINLVISSVVRSASSKALITHSLCCTADDLMSWLNREFPDICSLRVRCSFAEVGRKDLCMCVCGTCIFFSGVHVHACMHTLYLHVWVTTTKAPQCNRCHLLDKTTMLPSVDGLTA